MMMRMLSTALMAGALMTTMELATVRTATAQSRNEVRIQTRLAGGAINGVTPSGSARFRSRGASANFSVEVEDVALADGTVLTVTLMRGTTALPAGTLTLTLRGGEIDVNTNDGDAVPQAQSGDVVVVADGAGKALLSGVLR